MPLLPRHLLEAQAFRDRRRRAVSVHELNVAEVTQLTDEAVMIRFDVPQDLREAYRFRAGQHVVLLHDRDGKEIRRSYSICSAATGADLRIAVKQVPDGAFSSYATSELRAGERLRVMTPTGRFSPKLHPVNRSHYGAIAAGSGITPILSIVTTALEIEGKSRVSLLYVNRTRASTMFAIELDELRKRYRTRFDVHHVLSREPQNDALPNGRLDHAGLGHIFDTLIRAEDVDDWFICAPQDLTEAVISALAERGTADDRVHRELFVDLGSEVADAPLDLPSSLSHVTVTVGGRDTHFDVPSDGEPILVAALTKRPDLPYACRDGVCATCRAKVVEGEVVMDRCSALEREELRQGYVLTCQAHPVTARVVLDFDA